MSGPHPPHRALRRAGAVLAGFAATFALSVATDAALHAAGIFPPPGKPMSDGLFLLATAYRALYTVAGGWVVARLAPDRPMAHAMALAAIGLVAATAGAIATWGRGPAFGPAWYPIALVALTAPCIWAGARLLEARGCPEGAASPLSS